jgi:8-amino-7-oxononanoate synthase
VAVGHRDPLQWLRRQETQRRAAGLRRTLNYRNDHEPLVDLASNDYLALSRDPRVVRAAADAAGRWGVGATGSRLVTGSTRLHADLEGGLAGFVGTEAALVFSSGYTANVAVLTALTRPGDLVVSDAANHASIIDGARLSRAARTVVGHLDVAAVERAAAAEAAGLLVVTEGIFSVDGEAAPLQALHRVARRHGGLLVVDDAHGFGVVGPAGRGSAALAGLAGAPDVVITITLSKALGGQGGAVLGPREVIDHLVDAARSFIFDTGLAPPSVAAGLRALEVLCAEPERTAATRSRAERIAALAAEAGFTPTAPAAAIVALPVESPAAALAGAAEALRNGVRLGCFRPPSVPDGRSRLRLTARADLTSEDLAAAAHALAAAARVRSDASNG